MNLNTAPKVTFAILDRRKGVSELAPAAGKEHPLPAWYRRVYDIPLEELSIGDVSKACRQQMHLDYVVPIALGILRSEPLAGELYEGEILVSMKSIAVDYWPGHAEQANDLKRIVGRLLNEPGTPEEVRHDLEELLARTGAPPDAAG